MAYTEPPDLAFRTLVGTSHWNPYVAANVKYMKGRGLYIWPAEALRGATGTARPRGPVEKATAFAVDYVWEFVSGEARAVHARCIAPESLVGDTDPKLWIEWATDETSGDVRWVLTAAAVSAGDPLPPTALPESVTSTVTVPATASDRVLTEVTLSMTIAAEDALYWKLEREGDHSGDTAAGDVRLYALMLETG